MTIAAQASCSTCCRWPQSLLHVAAALAYLFVKRDNLILPMFTGRKNGELVPPEERIRSSRSWLAVLLFATLAAVLYVVIRRAPEASLFSF
jgi:hypothetical protein